MIGNLKGAKRKKEKKKRGKSAGFGGLEESKIFFFSFFLLLLSLSPHPSSSPISLSVGIKTYRPCLESSLSKDAGALFAFHRSCKAGVFEFEFLSAYRPLSARVLGGPLGAGRLWTWGVGKHAGGAHDTALRFYRRPQVVETGLLTSAHCVHTLPQGPRRLWCHAAGLGHVQRDAWGGGGRWGGGGGLGGEEGRGVASRLG